MMPVGPRVLVLGSIVLLIVALTISPAIADRLLESPAYPTTVERDPTPPLPTIPGGPTKWFQPGPDGVQRLLPQDAFLRVRGWIDGGYTYNSSSPPSHFNGPYNAIDRDIGQFNQLYLIIDKPLADTSRLDVGGRMDLLWGYDYYLAQSSALERREDGSQHWNHNQYGFAIPQAYAEVGNKTWSFKLGHFYTIIGYEGVPALNNFFYSKAYSYQFAGPFTHWGGIGTWNLDQHWTVQGGVVNGWNSLSSTHNEAAVLGKVTYTASQNLWAVSFAFITGDEPAAEANTFDTRTRLSTIITVRPLDRLEYVFHHYYAYQENGTTGGGTARWYGIDQYLYYTITKIWRAGLRFEWFRDENGTRVGGAADRGNVNLAPFPGSFYSLSAGVNYRPHPNVLIRPEVRSDWFDGTGLPYNDRNDTHQYLLAVDASLQF